MDFEKIVKYLFDEGFFDDFQFSTNFEHDLFKQLQEYFKERPQP